ncbi:4-diphosphocytidyl-2-C-methyl-D-erythritol kinase [hydrothermal vent metagenome]|uniref:4-(cytidine 5'-diphospho)-2-C-methyl-D-erythritol kinase n=1 Tax=hydrothermal vent metagenome TaxID=652676 RepID=A0A3B0U4S2_9ZZZZ
MIKPVFASAPAKINLCLHVTGRRKDGRHELESMVVFSALGDRLKAMSDKRDHLLVDGEFAKSIKPDTTNLVMDALVLFRSRFPDAVKTGLEIKLTKNLPVAAGIGGGSSDAAAMLRMMAQMSSSPIDPVALGQIAAQLGADVPVCLDKRPNLMAGIGEKLTPLAKLPPVYMVLANPGLAVSTKEIFAGLRRRENPPMPALPASFDNAQQLAGWLKKTRNDLENSACEMVPQIKTISGFFAEDKNCLFARMSGSGATVFALYQNEIGALTAARKAQKRWPRYWVRTSSIDYTNSIDYTKESNSAQ